MKKLFIFMFFALSYCSLSAQADNYKLIEWDIVRFGYAIPNGQYTAGITLGTEVRGNITNTISAGLRYELALLGSDEGDASASTSVALIGDYYFSDEKKRRPFVGLGIGSFAGGSIEVNGTDVDGGTALGLIPRLGFETGFLRLSAEYNLAFDDAVSNYFAIQVGFTLFGGTK